MGQVENRELNASMAAMESSITNFGVRFIPDSMVRAEYNIQAKKLSREIISDVTSGKITAAQGAERASSMRNLIMDTMRGKTSEIAKAYAVNQKTKGKSLSFLEQKYSKKLFSVEFEKLNGSQQNKIWKEIVFSAGRPQLQANKLAKILGRAGKGFIALTITISIYNIATADDKLIATAKESAVLGGGLLGSVAGGAAAGVICGPGAPVCVGIGIFVGGVMFAIGSEITFNSFWT
ncbi:putative membrane-associated [Moritella sp. JT01]|uniref:hypothetical protein n=1 Tax=Moritella sp. JT01 TaxID=756698 RepID=UPI00079C1ADC|nr:hypothetical protein [Moritella sp. JT01]KXO14164.1 putative membrane-associated [Moritella sp. JT01]